MYAMNRTKTSDASTYPPKKHIHTAANCKSFNYKTAKKLLQGKFTHNRERRDMNTKKSEVSVRHLSSTFAEPTTSNPPGRP